MWVGIVAVKLSLDCRTKDHDPIEERRCSGEKEETEAVLKVVWRETGSGGVVELRWGEMSL